MLKYQIGLARELGKTLKELERDLGQGEIAYQIAYDEIEADARSKRAEQTRHAAEALQRQGPRRR